MPLGLNPSYGLEFGSSLIYNDAVPLFALIFKALSPILPEPFQYFGFWLLACFILQAFFASKLVGLVTTSRLLQVAGSALFVFAPPMLFRLSGHWQLVGQWVILAALYLVLRQTRQHQSMFWCLLAMCTALVNLYLLAMVGLLWMSAWLGDCWMKRRAVITLAGEALFVPALVALALWQGGFFALAGGRGAPGFGAFRMNLISPVNSAGWSYVLPSVRLSLLEYEGFAFLGGGALVVAAFAAAAAISGRVRGAFNANISPVWLTLGGALLLMLVIAVSNQIAFGQHVFVYPLPGPLTEFARTMRSSGRFSWPVVYVLLLASVAAVVRGYPRGVSLTVLVVGALVQVVDTSAGWRPYQEHLHAGGRTLRSPLVSELWTEAPNFYHRLRLMPPGNGLEHWAVFADYAQRYGLATDAVSSGRIDPDRARALFDNTSRLLAGAGFDRETLYVLQENIAPSVACAIDTARDQIAFIDGFWVLLPDWKTRAGDRFADTRPLNCPVLSADSPSIELTRGSEGVALLTTGWSRPEPWATWSDGLRSVVTLKLQGRVPAVEFAATAMERPGPALYVETSIDGAPGPTWQTTNGEFRWYRIAIPHPEQTAVRTVRIGFTYSDIRSPASLGGSRDTRQLALAVSRVRIAP